MRGLMDPNRRPTVLHLSDGDAQPAPPVPPLAVTHGGAVALVAPEPLPVPTPEPTAEALPGELEKLRATLAAFALLLPPLDHEVRRFVYAGRIFGVFVYPHPFGKAETVHEVCSVHELTVDGGALARRASVTGNRTYTSTWADPLHRRATAETLAYMEKHHADR